jgi:hypothetical protein
MAGGGLSMLLRLFRWPTIIGQGWLGVLRPSPRKNLQTKGGSIFRIYKKDSILGKLVLFCLQENY